MSSKDPGSGGSSPPRGDGIGSTETEDERRARAERLAQRMDALEAEFVQRQAEFERMGGGHPQGGHGGPYEGGPWVRDPFGALSDLFPEQARSHFVNAQREWALALRDLVQYWIDRSGGADDRRPPPDRPKVM